MRWARVLTIWRKILLTWWPKLVLKRSRQHQKRLKRVKAHNEGETETANPSPLYLCTLHFALRSNIYIPDLASVNISEDWLSFGTYSIYLKNFSKSLLTSLLQFGLFLCLSHRFLRSKTWSRVLYSGAADFSILKMTYIDLVCRCVICFFYILNIVING